MVRTRKVRLFLRYIPTVGIAKYHCPILSILNTVNASSASDFIIDMKNMNAVELLPGYTLPDGSKKDIVSFEGGATSGHVLDALQGTGKSIITARVRTVGLGGFSTGTSATLEMYRQTLLI